MNMILGGPLPWGCTARSLVTVLTELSRILVVKIQGVPLATEPGISLIILPLMRI